MDDSSKTDPRYSVGDLVACVYDLYYHYMSPMYDDYEREPFIGIIVEVEYAMFSELFGYEIIYLVLCVDGIHRYFAEEEIVRMS